MNVASLENSKRLHELSEWGETYFVWRLHKPNSESVLLSDAEMKYDMELFKHPKHNRFREENDFYPAYDCGYLLRKLFETGYVWVKGVTEEKSVDGAAFWKGCWNVTGHHVEAQGCDTPEDALCLLAIKLFEEGVLTND